MAYTYFSHIVIRFLETHLIHTEPKNAERVLKNRANYFLVGDTHRQDDVLVVRSGRVLALSEWHSIRVGRYRRKLYLWVDGMVNYAVLQPSEGISDFENLIYFGKSNVDYIQWPCGHVVSYSLHA